MNKISLRDRNKSNKYFVHLRSNVEHVETLFQNSCLVLYSINEDVGDFTFILSQAEDFLVVLRRILPDV